MLQRSLEHDLNKWRVSPLRKPLILRGARQVGKSHLVEAFGAKYFNNTIVLNFELNPEYKSCFSHLDPKAICQAIQIVTGNKIEAGKTLLFFDEIQDCPSAIQALRYFKEQMPELHIVGAGSLLELALRRADFRMPVGRVEFLYLYPLSFKEYLMAFNSEVLEVIESCDLANPVPEAIHEHLIKHLRYYMLLGGMPESVAGYQLVQDFQQVQSIQASIIETYEKDFGHYSDYANVAHLAACFKQVPMMIGQQIKYNKIDPELRSRDLKEALSVLEDAGILQRIYATSAQGLPLDATVNDKKFKLNFIDIGLVKRINQLDARLLLEGDPMLLNRGALAEQFVGQELLSYALSFEKAKLYFWARDGQGIAEVDYIIHVGGQIFPVEVKAGKVGRLRSLKQYLLEHNCSYGVRVSEQPLSMDGNVMSVPFYLLSELDRLLD